MHGPWLTHTHIHRQTFRTNVEQQVFHHNHFYMSNLFNGFYNNTTRKTIQSSLQHFSITFFFFSYFFLFTHTYVYKNIFFLLSFCTNSTWCRYLARFSCKYFCIRNYFIFILLMIILNVNASIKCLHTTNTIAHFYGWMYIVDNMYMHVSRYRDFIVKLELFFRNYYIYTNVCMMIYAFLWIWFTIIYSTLYIYKLYLFYFT